MKEWKLVSTPRGPETPTVTQGLCLWLTPCPRVSTQVPRTRPYEEDAGDDVGHDGGAGAAPRRRPSPAACSVCYWYPFHSFPDREHGAKSKQAVTEVTRPISGMLEFVHVRDELATGVLAILLLLRLLHFNGAREQNVVFQMNVLVKIALKFFETVI